MTTDGGRPCEPGCGCTLANEVGEAEAQRHLRAYRRSGPPTTTRWLIEGLEAGGVEGLTVIDIGAGVGAVHHALLLAGARTAVDIDGSPAYVAAARAEAERRGTADRVTYEAGDFVAIADRVEEADLVALDRVVCCYPDWEALVRLSVGRARHRYGLVYPRDTWWVRALATVLNAVTRLARQRSRAYIHRTAGIDAVVRNEGLVPRLQRTGLFWQVVVYERPA